MKFPLRAVAFDPINRINYVYIGNHKTPAGNVEHHWVAEIPRPDIFLWEFKAVKRETIDKKFPSFVELFDEEKANG